MGSTYIQRGDLDRGLECCKEALALAPILPCDAAMAKAACGYADIKAGRIDAGIAELNKTLAWCDSSGLRHSYLRIRYALWLAEGHLRRGDHASARPLIDDALNTSDKTGKLHCKGLACWLMGESLAADQPGAAEEYVETAMQVLEEIGARDDLAKAMVTRAALRQALGDTTMARQLLEQAGAIFRTLGTLGEPERVEAALAALETNSEIQLLAGRS